MDQVDTVVGTGPVVKPDKPVYYFFSALQEVASENNGFFCGPAVYDALNKKSPEQIKGVAKMGILKSAENGEVQLVYNYGKGDQAYKVREVYLKRFDCLAGMKLAQVASIHEAVESDRHQFTIHFEIGIPEGLDITVDINSAAGNRVSVQLTGEWTDIEKEKFRKRIDRGVTVEQVASACTILTNNLCEVSRHRIPDDYLKMFIDNLG